MFLSPKIIPAARTWPKEPAASTSTKVIPTKWMQQGRREANACVLVWLHRIGLRWLWIHFMRQSKAGKICRCTKGRGGEGSTLFDFVWLCQADQTFSSFRGWFLTWLTHRVSREHVASRVDQVQSLFELCVSCCPWCIPVSDSEEHSGSRSTHGHVGRRTNETTWVQVLWQPVRSYHARRRETTTRDTRNLKRERRKKERKKERKAS